MRNLLSNLKLPNFKLAATIAAIAAFLAFGAVVEAQQTPPNATPTYQAAQRADVATFLQGPAGGAAACNTINSSVANMTVTITPQGGMSVYVTGVYVDIFTNATGAASLATMSATNLTGSPIWSLGTNVTTANVYDGVRQIAETYPTTLKSAIPGTAVVFAPSAQNAQSIYCIRVAGYFAP